MSEFELCPVCREQSDQCLSCASYVVDDERIYYEKLKDFGATKDHEIRFINRIQKHRVTAFFHNGKMYIPSRQGRSVPLAIGLQWDAWQEQQAIIDNLKAQLKTRKGKSLAAMLHGTCKCGEPWQLIVSDKEGFNLLHCFNCNSDRYENKEFFGDHEPKSMRGASD